MFSYHLKNDQISILFLLLCCNSEKKKLELSLEGSLIFYLSLGNGL
jgi:hypothetical protein